MTYIFELAKPEDDSGIRNLLRNNVMPGDVNVRFEREPDYFLGCSIMGNPCEVIITRDQTNGEIAAVMCRSIRNHYVNGLETTLGYFSQLRVDIKYRGKWIPSLGQSFVYELHKDNPVRAYYTVVTDENKLRRLLLSSKYHGFPRAHEIGEIYTLGIFVRKPVVEKKGELEIVHATIGLLDQIVEFLNKHGKVKQFYPVYKHGDFMGSPTLLDFNLQDLILGMVGNNIVGCIGLWDQTRYKQTVIHSYRKSMEFGRPLINGLLRLTGAKALPAPGEHLQSAYASMICIEGNDATIFATILSAVYNLAVYRGISQLMLGLSTEDPLLKVAQKYMHFPYHSRIILLEIGEATMSLNDNIPYIEIAAL